MIPKHLKAEYRDVLTKSTALVVGSRYNVDGGFYPVYDAGDSDFWLGCQSTRRLAKRRISQLENLRGKLLELESVKVRPK